MGGRGSEGNGSSGGGFKSSGMEKLTGSEKQISYANQLRQNVINGLREALPEIKKVAPSKEAASAAEKKINQMVDNLKSASSAGDVIDLFKDVRFSGSKEEVFGKIMAVYNVTVPQTTGQRKILGR